METLTLTFFCPRGRGEVPDCAHKDEWKVEAVRGEYGALEHKLVVLASDASCPQCQATGEAQSDESVYVLPGDPNG